MMDDKKFNRFVKEFFQEQEEQKKSAGNRRLEPLYENQEELNNGSK